MINALMQKADDVVVAKWYPSDETMEQGKIIKFKFYTEWRSDREQPVQNLMCVRNETQIQTRYNYDFKKNDKLYFAGEYWLILDVAREFDKRESEKSLALNRVQLASKYVRMTVVKVV